MVIEEVNGQYLGSCDIPRGFATIALVRHSSKDANKYNIFVANDGVEFVDFEELYIRLKDQDEKWILRMFKGMQVLGGKLLDESGEGHP